MTKNIQKDWNSKTNQKKTLQKSKKTPAMVESTSKLVPDASPKCLRREDRPPACRWSQCYGRNLHIWCPHHRLLDLRDRFWREEIKNWGENAIFTWLPALNVVKTPLVSFFKDDWIKISEVCALLSKIWNVGFEISMSNFGYPIFRFHGFSLPMCSPVFLYPKRAKKLFLYIPRAQITFMLEEF